MYLSNARKAILSKKVMRWIPAKACESHRTVWWCTKIMHCLRTEWCRLPKFLMPLSKGQKYENWSLSLQIVCASMCHFEHYLACILSFRESVKYRARIKMSKHLHHSQQFGHTKEYWRLYQWHALILLSLHCKLKADQIAEKILKTKETRWKNLRKQYRKLSDALRATWRLENL